MTYTQANIQAFLAELPPFDQLPSAALTEMVGRTQLLRYRMGQAIFVRERMPNQIAIIYEGQARLLGIDPWTQKPLTLKLLELGEILGWVGWMRGVPCETAIASTEAICLTIPAEEFWHFCSQYPQFGSAFHDRCALAEAFDLLSQELEQQAQRPTNINEVTQNAFSHAEIAHMGADSPQPPPDPNRVWFLSGGAEVEDYPVGSRLQSAELANLKVKGDHPARLVGFRQADLSAIGEQTTTNGQTNGSPQQQTTEPKIPYAPEQPPEGSSNFSNGLQAEPKYPHVRSKSRSPLDTAMACFQMLSQYFGIPFRREVIHRVLTNQLRQGDNVSLPQAGAVAEMMGLKAQLVKVPSSALTRLNPPALIRWEESFAVLYEASANQLVLGVPEIGIVKRQPADFMESWGDGGQVLLLQSTKETPQERFGLRWFIPYIKQYKGILLLVFVASFFVQLFGLANPLMIQVIINKVIIQNSPDTLQVLGVFLLVIAIFEAVLSSLRTYLFVNTTNRIDMSLGSEIIDHLLRLPLRYFERRPVGEISSRVNELEKIRQFLTGTALTVVLDAIFSVVYIVVLLIYSWKLTLATLAIIPVFILLTLFFSPTIRRQLRTKAERNAETQSYLVESLSGIQTVKAQNIELRTRWQWQERYSRYVSAGFQTVVTQTLSSSTSNFLNKFSGLIVLWFGAYLVLQGQLNLGQLIAFRIIAGYVTGPILRLSQVWQNFQETALSLERLSDIVDTPQEAEQDRENIPMPAINGAVRYENISFRFKQNNPIWQLENVSLEVEPGTLVGVVGQSGAGKSTLTKLLARLYEPEKGRILVDGYDIGKVELYSLRRQIGFVPQDTLLFEGSVQENIALTNPDATTEEVIEAARIACAHEFIMDLASGYNTKVGERGAALSGGQRQRVAIARTILQRPQLLVLDEATSALDYPTERQVCANLAQVFAEQTVFFITHRLGSIKNSDAILMMDSGRVAEKGTHQELMGMRGRYYSLYQQQEAQIN